MIDDEEVIGLEDDEKEIEVITNYVYNSNPDAGAQLEKILPRIKITKTP